jgi:hypothetical protein
MANSNEPPGREPAGGSLLPGASPKEAPAAAAADSPPQPAIGADAAAPAPTPRAGSLADHLERTSRHPVIVFGIGASGKSTMLMSLVQALNRNSEVNAYLGDPIFPPGNDEAVEEHEQAIQFFERDAQQFAIGELVPPTRHENPFFIPVDVQRKSDGRMVRLALLEGKGEWYAPIRGGTGSMFPKFKEDIADILSFYGESLSVLWVAPFSVGGGKDQDTQDSDLGLLGALNEYRKLRRSIAQDFHLFLLTKWDCKAEPLADDPSFSVVSAQKVERILEERYPNSWPNYQGLALQTSGRRFFMQYSSGHIVQERVKVPPQRHRTAFDRYPRTVWNWLYGNATLTQIDAEHSRKRATLFPDVLPQPVRRAPFLERISRVLVSR